MHNTIRNFIHLIILLVTIVLFYQFSPSYKVQAAGMYLPLSSGYPKVDADKVDVVFSNDYPGSLYSYKQIGTVTVTVPYSDNFHKSEKEAFDYAKDLVSKNGANVIEVDMISGPRIWFNTSSEVVTIQAKVLKG